MLAMDSGVGESIEVIARGDVGAEGRRVLVPLGVLEGIVIPRGAVHRGVIRGCSDLRQAVRF